MYLCVPTLLIAVPLFERTTGNGQEIVDRDNSAVIFHWNGLSVIADHSYQSNFSNLNKVKPNRTRAYIYKSKLETILCDDSQIGHILLSENGNRLVDQNFNLVHTVFTDGYCIYTCRTRSAQNVIDVRLTHWKIL